jgi:hypothetical protein
MSKRPRKGFRLDRLGTALAAAALLLPLLVGAATTAAADTTVSVNVELQSHNNGILDGGSASYYAGGQWRPITSENANNPAITQTQLPPGTYSFAMVYNGTRDQKTVTIGSASSAQTVYFHAALVNVELQSHNNGILDIPGNGSASYYAGGWHPITTENVNNPSMVQAEMLPGTYSFAVVYNGTRDQKRQTIVEPNPNNGAGSVQTVYFHYPFA